MSSGIRGEYERQGVRQYYLRHGDQYRNPHEHALRAALMECLRSWPLDLSYVLDLACGSGEITLALQQMAPPDQQAGLRVDGIDPFTAEAYRRRTGRACEPFTFEQIASGALAGRRYSLIVCSYALHLVAESRLPALLFSLAQLSPALLVFTPHKRPLIPANWGWTQVGEMLVARVRARYYLS